MLNFKDWKLASSTNEKATLRHAMGHEMTIAVKALPKIQREQIMRLAKIQQYSGGGGVNSEGSPETVQPDSGSTSDAPNRQPAAAPGATITINAGGGQQPAQQPAPAAAPQQPQPEPPPPQSPALKYANTAMPNVAVPGNAAVLPVLDRSGQPIPNNIEKNAQAGVLGDRDVDIAMAKGMLPINKGLSEGEAENQSRVQDALNLQQKELEGLKHDTNNGKINPEGWWDKPGIFGETGGAKKAFAAIGLALGGLGAGQLGSTDNPALRALNSQIERDIESQQKSFNNRNTIVGAYQHLFGDTTVAANMAHNAMLEIYKGKVGQLANALGTPRAFANAAKLTADMAQEQSKKMNESAIRIASLPGALRGSGGGGGTVSSTGGGGQPSGMTTQELQAMHQKQANGPVQAGLPPSGSAKEERAPRLGGKSENNSQLKKGSGESLKNLQKFDIFAKDPNRSNDLQRQHDQQIKIDEQLNKVDDTYDKLFHETNGIFGRIHRGINPHAIAATTGAIGTGLGALGGAAATGPLAGLGAVPGGTAGGTLGVAVGEGIGHGLAGLTNTAANQSYDADFETLKGIISAALPGRGDAFVTEAAERYAPTSQDSEKDAIKKREAFKQFIVDHASNGILKQYNLIN